MREMKFRTWYKKEYPYPDKKQEMEHFTLESLCDNNNGDDLEDFEVMEWTGLQDKNGVDIYEGDIVLLCGGYSYSIVFYNGSFVMNGIKDTWMQKPIDVNHIEVTGNIHDNNT